MRRRISLSDGSASSSRFSPRCFSRSLIWRACTVNRLAALARLVPIRSFCSTLSVSTSSPDLVGHRLQQLRAVVGPDLACRDQRVDQNLDVHLVVGAVDARGVVQRVGVDPAAGQVIFDPPQRGQPEVATLTDHLGPHLITVHPDDVVGAVTDIDVRLGLGLDVGADAAVEQQIRPARTTPRARVPAESSR